ncbi:hypothetical protein LGQ02_04700 [Bacillus shivajii]|uniref:hypothetical protein n=1 Tax=Bacillus shivajii TaxID=1983719 RepID=UPI001CF9D396|nr:hypothetical protein [Bacillus shivajii]UCZ54085.1 hypothetical protein LGQ02_04700 [Bacillus shivajii]
MRKVIISGVVLLFIGLAVINPKTSAHVAGVFHDFLLGIGEGTEEELKRELEETRQEIERLEPQVEQLKSEYDVQEDEAVAQLTFYQSIGLDTYMNFILQSEEFIDVLANQRIVEKHLDEFLTDLNDLYLMYRQLEVMEASLRGHEELLKIISGNLKGRQKFMEEHEHLQDRPGMLARAVHYQWSFRTERFGTLLERDHFLVKDELDSLIKNVGAYYVIEEEDFNERTHVDYLFRSDHVYIHHQTEDAHVVLVALFINEDGQVKLDLEAGFIDGMAIGQDILEELFTIEFAFSEIDGEPESFHVEHLNGSIQIHPIYQSEE